MMKALGKIYHFLGSIYFALLLIALVAIFVIAGTLIESSTQSHRYAARFTYSNPLFVILLWGFFINILLSALRRWPFKVRHLPFLITHFGLLMILAGVLIKAYVGLQGTMGVMEGAAAHRIFEADTYVVHVERQGERPHNYNLNELIKPKNEKTPGLSLQVVNYLPNSTERLATWIKGEQATIQDLHPMQVHDITDTQDMEEVPLSGRARFNSLVWEVYALRTSDISQAVNRLYLQGTLLKISDRASGITLATVPLSEALSRLNHSILLSDKQGAYGEAKIHLHLGFSDIEGFQHPMLELKVLSARDDTIHEVSVPLGNELALLNVNKSTPYLGSSPIAIDILRTPMLAMLEDQHNDTHLVAFNGHGQVWSKSFGNNHIHSYLSYDEGFGGYAVQSDLPFAHFVCGREQREKSLINYLSTQMRLAISTPTQLSPPLLILQDACQKANVDFVDTLVTFLRHWDAGHSWLYAEDQLLPETVEKVFKHLNWQKHPREACRWTARLFDHIEPAVTKGNNPLDALRERRWPLIAACEEIWKQSQSSTSEKTGSLMTLLTQQIFSAADQLPVENEEVITAPPTSQQHARLLSAYLRAYGIHLSTITPVLKESEMLQLIQKSQDATESERLETAPVTIETQLVAVLEAAPANKKLEDNVPAITLRAQEGNRLQTISLGYDRSGMGLKWPILNGEYVLRFQPRFLEIPYNIRLRQARQINYANSKQAYSYESDIVVTDLRTGHSVEKTISMNQVHETWDGYRFYLSNITPADESTVKRVQIAVNHDPAKYWLTYPGAIILSLGIILLFWMRPYQIQNKKSSRH